MRKSLLVALCCIASLAASAQSVKDLERTLKASPADYNKHIGALKTAMDSPEAAEDPYAWFVAGKAGMDYYDNQLGLKSIGRPVDDKAMGQALADSYGYLTNALRRDSVPDAKGKIKAKYSKDIIKLIKNHYNDYNVSAVNLWGVQDYNGAYRAWDLYTSIPNDPVLGKNAPAAPHDTIMCDIYYNMGIAAWQAERLDDALSAFDKAIAKGYDKKNIFDYAIGIAYSMQDNAKMAYYAALAQPLYGKEDTRYIGYMINDKISNKQYDEARDMLEQFIAQDPNNSQLYYVLGILYDSQEMPDVAMENYKKAIDLDPNNAQALLQYGRQLCNKAYALDDSFANLSAQEYNERRANEINPIFREAATYLEKAYEIAPDDMHDALNFLRNIYYNLNDQTNLERIENL